MQIRAYTVYDNKALVYNQPFYAPTDGAALRMFEEIANDMNTSVGRHPGDYSIWWCGTWDDQSGQFAPQIPLVRVADATALVKQQPALPLAPVSQAHQGDSPSAPQANGAGIPQDFMRTGGR